MGTKPRRHTLTIAGRDWLSPHIFEVRFRRPRGFRFLAGQKIRFLSADIGRDYTLVNGPGDPMLAICVRLVPNGRFSPLLAAARPDETFEAEGPSGFFTCQPSIRPKIFVATGTGIAPFVSFVRDGVRDFTCLHGVREPEELCYRAVVAPSARIYLPCLSGGKKAETVRQGFRGRVTRYLRDHLVPGVYDFYVCGRSEMVAEAVHVIDEKFEGSRVFTEIFH
jgi:benzoate/toluate 1,2-dioxygenase reductase subunit